MSPFSERVVGDCSLFSTKENGNIFSFMDFYLPNLIKQEVETTYNRTFLTH